MIHAYQPLVWTSGTARVVIIDAPSVTCACHPLHWVTEIIALGASYLLPLEKAKFRFDCVYVVL